jgi:CRISPR-associated protein Csb2
VVTRFVPNNDGDKVLDRQSRLTGKTCWPTIMFDTPEIHYLWPVGEECSRVPSLIAASRCLVCLGWGIDMAYGNCQLLDEEQSKKLTGIRWFPRPGTLRDYGLLRVPKQGSMADLRRAHRSVLARIEQDESLLRTVYKPQVFDRVFYSSIERPLGRPAVVFALRTSGDDPYPYPHAKLMHLAGMTRHVAIEAMTDYPPDGLEDAAAWVESFVAGHRPAGNDNHERFSYVPLPSIGHKHADAIIRRMMIAAPFGYERHLNHLVDQLQGIQLQPEDGRDGPVLERLERPRTDAVAHRYLQPSSVWASVTPVILSGHDDCKPAKTIKLIERALRQSGIDQPCQFTWGALPNFSNCLTAYKYDREKRHIGYYRPQHLEGLTAVHIRVAFDHPIPGPLYVGAGRHYGFGVLASVSRSTSQSAPVMPDVSD